MNYILCHKNIKVLNVQIVSDAIYKINSIYNEEHLPLFLKSSKMNDKSKTAAFKEWWKGRCIPASRQNLDKVLSRIGGMSLESLLVKSMGLSLSDQYWIKPESSGLKWEDVNFYENDFSSDIGDLFFGMKLSKKINFVSPDNTSDGWLLKKWVIKDGKRLLIKGGSAPYEQEPFNEVLASEICERLGIPHAKYALTKIEDDSFKDNYFCVCDNVTTSDTELVSAWNVLNTKKSEKRISNFKIFLNRCDELGVATKERLKNDIGKMILLDFITANTDRHYNNFSFLRNSNTLEWFGLAPIFDTGTSMFNKTSTEELKLSYYTDSKKIQAKPFYKNQQKQLESFSTMLALQKINFDSLEGISGFYSDLLSINKKISGERRKILTEQLDRRIKHARAIVYRKNEITKKFLKLIHEDNSSRKMMDKISSSRIQVSSENPAYKNILDNYLRNMRPKNEMEMEKLIVKDVNYFFGRKEGVDPLQKK